MLPLSIYSQYQKGLSIILLTSLFLQSCNGLSPGLALTKPEKDLNDTTEDPSAAPAAASPSVASSTAASSTAPAATDSSVASSIAASSTAPAATSSPAAPATANLSVASSTAAAPATANPSVASSTAASPTAPAAASPPAAPGDAEEKSEASQTPEALPSWETLVEAIKQIKDRCLFSAEIKKVGKLVEDSPNILEALCKIANDDEKNWFVRRVAIQALGQLVKRAPTHAEAVWEVLQGAFTHRSHLLRQGAIQASVQLAQEDSNYVAPVCQALQHALTDDTTIVREAAVKALDQVGQATPAHAEAALPALYQAVEDTSGNVRQSAVRVLGQVAKSAPGCLDDVLMVLCDVKRDKFAMARQAAIEAIGELVQAVKEDPTALQTALSALCQAVEDTDANVRQSAVRVLGQMAESAPGCAEAVQKVIRDANGGEDTDQVAVKETEAAPGCLDAVSKALYNPEKDKADSIRSLGQIGQRSLAPQISVKGLVESATDPRRMSLVKPALAELLQTVIDRRSRETLNPFWDPLPHVLRSLLQALGNDNQWVRQAAIEAIEQLVQAVNENPDAFYSVTATALPVLQGAISDATHNAYQVDTNPLEQLREALFRAGNLSEPVD